MSSKHQRRPFHRPSGSGMAASSGIEAYRHCLRQIHLDFHTPDTVPDFLKNFRTEDFVATLREARVQGIKIFSKCEFGNSYYFTRAGVRHPQLTRDWLREVGEALHAADILCFAHYSVFCDRRQARLHPEWGVVFPTFDEDGRWNRKGIPSTRNLCPCSPYVAQIVLPQVRELSDYPVAGIFLDIFQFPDGDRGSCVCENCQREFRRRMGCDLSPQIFEERPDWISAFRARVISERREAVIAAFKEKARDKITMFNHAHIASPREWDPETFHRCPADVGVCEAQPTVAMGYRSGEHACRILRPQGVPFEVLPFRFMSGWGDGTLKPLCQMNLENALIVAQGGIVSLGDHLPPNGELEKKVYERIGRSFRFLEEREPFLFETQAVPFAAILSRADDIYWNRAVAGAECMLTDRHIPTDILSLNHLDGLPNYKALVLPDRSANPTGSTLRKNTYRFPIPKLGEADLEKIAAWVAAGGCLIVSGNAISSETPGTLADELLGGKVGDIASSWGYWYGEGSAVPESYDGFPLLAQMPFRRFDPTTATPLLSWRHPMRPEDPDEDIGGKRAAGILAETPAVVLNRYGKGKVLTFACPIFLDYADTRHPWLDELFGHLSAPFYQDSPIQVENGGPSLRTHLRRGSDGVLYADLIFGHPEEIAIRFPEAGIPSCPAIRHEYPLTSVAIRLRNVIPQTVTLEPGGHPLAWETDSDGIRLWIPEIKTYQILRVVPQSAGPERSGSPA